MDGLVDHSAIIEFAARVCFRTMNGRVDYVGIGPV